MENFVADLIQTLDPAIEECAKDIIKQDSFASPPQVGEIYMFPLTGVERPRISILTVTIHWFCQHYIFSPGDQLKST